jgi:GTPase SAR1 family protein
VCRQDEYTILNSKHAIGIHGFVLVYSVASRKSFDMVQVVYDKIINFCGLNQIPCVIVGSKTDLSTRYVAGPACRRERPLKHFCSHDQCTSSEI